MEGRTAGAVEYVEYQSPRARDVGPEIPGEQFQEAVQLILPDGRVLSGAEAIFVALRDFGGVGWPLFIFERVAGAATAARAGYRFVASHRKFFSWLTGLLWGKDPEPSSHAQIGYIFIRALALVYLVAFASLSSQIVGLAGEKGIMPAAQLMAQVKSYCVEKHVGISRYFLLPTLCWFNASDGFLRGLNIAGIVLSAFLLVGIAPRLMLVLLWLVYLSLTIACGVFLQFQWDSLLLETGLLAIFFAPWTKFSSPRKGSAPPIMALWLLRWLLFRLMFQSGCVKLLSGDPLWHNLTALGVHFETQPLPTWIGWYAHQLPSGVLKVFCALMLIIELVVPFLIFLPRRPRRWAFGPLVGLQIAILLTGNYCFFNWLAIPLCLLLLDDKGLPKPLQGRVVLSAKPRRFQGIPLVLLAAVIAVLTSAQLLGMFKARWVWAGPVVALYEAVGPFRSINSYGLFAVMTSSRPEILVEGSEDGREWKAYRFMYKPQDLDSRPGFVAPHQPRLDWQMWFAALGTYHENPWFVNFCIRLLQASPEVLNLLESNPFPDQPPRFIRAVTYDYRFTHLTNAAVPSLWWRREGKGEYLPPISLQNTSAEK